jgi:hypothetical protein
VALPIVREQTVDNASRSHSTLSVAGRLAVPGQRIDHGLDERQLNRLGIGRFDLVHSARSEQPQGLIGEAREAECSRCSDDLNLIFVLERVVVPDTDTLDTGTKAEDAGDEILG